MAFDLSRLLSIQGGLEQGPPDAPTWSTGGVTLTRNPQTGAWENPVSEGDSELQKLIDQGVITASGVDYGKLPKTVFGTPIGDTHGAGYRQVQVDANGRIVDPSGNWNISNPGAVRNDPYYGWITPSRNISNKDDWYDVASGTVLPSLIAAGLTAGAGTIGAGVPWYASAGMKALQGGLSNPLSILSTLAPGLNELGIPSWVTALGKMGAGVIDGTDQGQKQYSTPIAGTTTPAQVATASPVAPATSNVASGAITQIAQAPATTDVAAPAVQYLPDPQSAIPDTYNAQAFGGGMGDSSQVISDQGSAPVSTLVAPDAYNNSYSQIVS